MFRQLRQGSAALQAREQKSSAGLACGHLQRLRLYLGWQLAIAELSRDDDEADIDKAETELS